MGRPQTHISLYSRLTVGGCDRCFNKPSQLVVYLLQLWLVCCWSTQTALWGLATLSTAASRRCRNAWYARAHPDHRWPGWSTRRDGNNARSEGCGFTNKNIFYMQVTSFLNKNNCCVQGVWAPHIWNYNVSKENSAPFNCIRCIFFSNICQNCYSLGKQLKYYS